MIGDNNDELTASQKDIGTKGDETNTTPIKPIEGKLKQEMPDVPLQQSKAVEPQDKDLEALNAKAKKYGYDFTKGNVPTDETEQERIRQNLIKAAPQNSMSRINAFLDSYSKPQLEKTPELNKQEMLNREKKARRIRWADALYAFGEGLQGRTANPETFASTRLQRKNDEEFQNYKAVVDRNRIAQNAYNQKQREDAISFIDKLMDDERIDKKTKDELQLQKDKLIADKTYKEKQLTVAQQNADANTARAKAEAVKASKTGQAVKSTNVKIKTSNKTFDLPIEEANYYKIKAMQNLGFIADKYPSMVKVTPVVVHGRALKDKYNYSIAPGVKDNDLIGAYLEHQQEIEQPSPQPQSSTGQNKQYSTSGLYTR